MGEKPKLKQGGVYRVELFPQTFKAKVNYIGQKGEYHFFENSDLVVMMDDDLIEKGNGYLRQNMHSSKPGVFWEDKEFLDDKTSEILDELKIIEKLNLRSIEMGYEGFWLISRDVVRTMSKKEYDVESSEFVKLQSAFHEYMHSRRNNNQLHIGELALTIKPNEHPDKKLKTKPFVKKYKAQSSRELPQDRVYELLDEGLTWEEID